MKNKKNKTLTYAGTGVDYNALDPFKRAAQIAGRNTAKNIGRFGFSELASSRGESAYLIETPERFLAHVEEGLGTKNLVADEMYRLTGRTFYRNIAQDTVAMIVNDMVTLGALPVSVAMHLAVGDSEWFKNPERAQDLVLGWEKACNMARCAWGGGETPALKNVVCPGAAVLAGSALGVIEPKSRLIAGDIEDGDRIILAASSGIHANGLTLARKIAESLPDGYLTKIPGGRTYGESLLDPTPIYVGLVEDCFKEGIRIKYAANITGHGWRKLMRLNKDFTYVIEKIPPVPAVLQYIKDQGKLDDREAYGNLNMGAGFAIYVGKGEAQAVVNAAQRLGIQAWDGGWVQAANEKKVVVNPLGIEFAAADLKVR